MESEWVSLPVMERKYEGENAEELSQAKENIVFRASALEYDKHQEQRTQYT